MKHLLSADSLAVVERVANEPGLCAFDFDGTLAPIVADPKRAAMRARTHDLLAKVAALYPCLVLSGRSRDDLLGKLDGVVTARVIGNHGSDTGHANSSRHLVESWRTELETALAAMPGVWIEDKGLSLAVHYRQSTQKVEARRNILTTVRTLKRTRIIGGKQVVNVVPAGAPDKGDALAAERDRLRCNWVLYAGDDENDEDAFALEGNVVSVRIGCKRRSHARYYLRAQAEIDKLLELLVRLRENKTPA